MPQGNHTLVPASYLLLIKDGKVLLLRRCNTNYEDGKYSVPAGHVEKGETFTQCVIREAKEEIGITVKAEDLHVVHIMQRITKAAENNERIDTFFTTEKYTGEIENKEPNKCDDLSWFDINNLPENTIAYIKQAIETVEQKKFYSEFLG